MSEAVAPWITKGGASAPLGEDERFILTALLILLHEGGSYKVTFILPELLELLGWPVAKSSWEAIERALDFFMQPVQREYCVSPPPGGRGQEVCVTSMRRLVAGHDYYEESEIGTPESVDSRVGRSPLHSTLTRRSGLRRRNENSVSEETKMVARLAGSLLFSALG